MCNMSDKPRNAYVTVYAVTPAHATKSECHEQACPKVVAHASLGLQQV